MNCGFCFVVVLICFSSFCLLITIFLSNIEQSCSVVKCNSWQVYDETEPADKPTVAEKGRKFQKVNWMKAAFLSADKVLTVSPTYAEEIASNESLGVELDGVIRCVFD